MRGEPKEKELPWTKTLAGRARMWMVDGQWLSTHREQDHPNRLAASGRLWGDAEDPEEVDERVKGVKAEKKAKKSDKKRKAGDDGEEKSTKKQKKGKGKESEESGTPGAGSSEKTSDS